MKKLDSLILSFQRAAPRNSLPHSGRKSNGFTLVEVVLSLGIFAFAILPVVGVMDVTLNVSNKSIESSTLGLMFRQSEAYVATTGTTTPVPAIYFSNTGEKLADNDSRIIYKVDFTDFIASDAAQGLVARRVLQMTVARTATPTKLISQQFFQSSREPRDVIPE